MTGMFKIVVKYANYKIQRAITRKQIAMYARLFAIDCKNFLRDDATRHSRINLSDNAN